MKIKLITPVGLYKEGEIEALHVKTVDGELTLLPHHMPKKEIDIERAHRAKKRAEERLAKKDTNTNIRRAEIALAKAINRIHVYGE